MKKLLSLCGALLLVALFSVSHATGFSEHSDSDKKVIEIKFSRTLSQSDMSAVSEMVQSKTGQNSFVLSEDRLVFSVDSTFDEASFKNSLQQKFGTVELFSKPVKMTTKDTPVKMKEAVNSK